MPVNAKEYLQRVSICDAQIDNKIAEVERLRSMLVNITSSIKDDVVSGSFPQDKIGETIAKIVDMESEINAEIDGFYAAKKDVQKVLNNMTDASQIKVLHKRYFQRLPWAEIAESMNLTEQRIFQIHNEALASFNETLNHLKNYPE